MDLTEKHKVECFENWEDIQEQTVKVGKMDNFETTSDHLLRQLLRQPPLKINFKYQRKRCMSLAFSVLYHFSRTGGQQLFGQTAKAHVDHIAEGLKKRLAAHCTVSGFH